MAPGSTAYGASRLLEYATRDEAIDLGRTHAEQLGADRARVLAELGRPRACRLGDALRAEWGVVDGHGLQVRLFEHAEEVARLQLRVVLVLV